MPDENKLSMMKEVGYEIVDSCATCSFGPMQTAYANGWGQCMNLMYTHGKHKAKMQMPAHIAFKCSEHRRAPWVDHNLGFYANEPWKEIDRDDC